MTIKDSLVYWKLITGVAAAMIFSLYVNANGLMTFFNILGVALVVAPFEPNFRKYSNVLMRVTIVALATYVTIQM
ncbi:hypothetical protein DC915_RS02250 [Vibrio parahaemolyticus]|nr:hypothetical protein [Vibrio parahaemolyticus]EJG0009797.1 hypothetical protein [Vibrio parahaemolyticus]ELA8176632.1 hypothetical protein [Vibrio alginolyticus]